MATEEKRPLEKRNRETTEQLLARTRERYRLLVENVDEYAMFTMDKNGIIDAWNAGAERILGYREEEALGKPGEIIFTPEDRAAEAPEREMRTAREKGQAADERWHLRKDGSRFWGRGIVSSLWDDGELRGYAKIMRDNTARKEAEEALRQSEARYRELAETLEERVQERTAEVRHLAEQMVATEQRVRQRLAQTLHDNLQQLLYAMQVQLKLLDEEMVEQEDLDELRDTVARALQVTRQLTGELSPPVLRQKEGLQETLQWLAGHMEESYGLHVAVESSYHPETASEERRIMLVQIVGELLFNVAKHAGVQEATVTVGEEDGRLTLTVSDLGRGFDVEEVLSGTSGGFGLSSVHERLQLFGGRTEIESRPGEGTQVHLYLPRLSEAGSTGQ